MDEPLISIVVVTWNAKKYVDECLRSVHRDDELPVEVIVVDNASSDGTPDLVAKQFPAFRLLRNPVNLGFARANNLGIQQSHGRYLCLLNSDVVVPVGCFKKLYEFMDRDPDVGLVGPQMLGPDGSVRRSSMRSPSLLNAFARALALDNWPLLSRYMGGQMMSDFNHRKIAEVEILNGWFWFIRREALEDVGLLDERFFMYGEDMDWCCRFRKAGWKVVFYPGASAIHYGGGSSKAAPVRFYIEMQKANLQYWKKHRGSISRSVYYAIVFIHNALRFAGYLGTLLLPLGNKDEAAAKIRRSGAVLLWMMGLRKSFA